MIAHQLGEFGSNRSSAISIVGRNNLIFIELNLLGRGGGCFGTRFGLGPRLTIAHNGMPVSYMLAKWSLHSPLCSTTSRNSQEHGIDHV